MISPGPQPVITPITRPKRITILGATGTIGQNTIDLLRQHKDRFRVTALTGGRNVQKLAELALELQPKWAVIEDQSEYETLKTLLAGTSIEAAAGADAITDIATEQTDIVISGIVGVAGLAPTLAALRQGTTVGLANKECLVCAGELMIKEAERHNATLLPVDSEHNALFQILDGRSMEGIQNVTLTASGGPFRTWTTEQMARATPEQAIAHPNWRMGAKISVDSATMMNKGLELIEAHYLFGFSSAQLNVVVHPESIVHAMVSYRDGASLAALSLPDMRVPIAAALSWPERLQNSTAALDLAALGTLTFEAPDLQRFPALSLARSVLETGGSIPAILNTANEVVVDAFINQSIRFSDIISVIKEVLNRSNCVPIKSIDHLIEITEETRKQTSSIIQGDHAWKH